MATKEELLERFQTDPEMQAEARRIAAAGKLSMADALRLYRKYRPEIPREKLLYYFSHIPEGLEKARRRGLL